MAQVCITTNEIGTTVTIYQEKSISGETLHSSMLVPVKEFALSPDRTMELLMPGEEFPRLLIGGGTIEEEFPPPPEPFRLTGTKQESTRHGPWLTDGTCSRCGWHEDRASEPCPGEDFQL